MSRRVRTMGAVPVIAGSGLMTGAASADTELLPHPASVNEGSCLDVGAVVAPLGDVSSELLVEGTPTLTELATPPEFAIPAEASLTTIAVAPRRPPRQPSQHRRAPERGRLGRQRHRDAARHAGHPCPLA